MMLDIDGPLHICPCCDSEVVERIVERAAWRGAVERFVVGVFGQRHYRCRDCGTRFYDRPALRRAS